MNRILKTEGRRRLPTIGRPDARASIGSGADGRAGGYFQAEMTRMELYCLFSCNVITTFYRTNFPIAVVFVLHMLPNTLDRKLEGYRQRTGNGDAIAGPGCLATARSIPASAFTRICAVEWRSSYLPA